MPEKSPPPIHLTASAKAAEEASRVLPLAAATVVCFLAAVTLGYGSWYFFGSHRWQKTERDFEYTVTNFNGNLNAAPKNEQVEISSSPAANQQTAPASSTETNVETAPAKPENVVNVTGGEITLGGDDSGRPLKRALVSTAVVAVTPSASDVAR